MISTYEELIEKMAEAIINQTEYSISPEKRQAQLRAQQPYWNDVAKAALQALLESLPNNNKEIETQARNMQLQCIRDNPTAGTVPSILHYEQQLSFLDKSAEYYKQLLAMRKTDKRG